MNDRAAGMAISAFICVLMPPVAIYLMWRVQRDQADAVLANIQREIREKGGRR